MAKARLPNQDNPMEEIEEIEYPFHVKESIINLMFLPELHLSSAEVVKQDMLAMKLESCKNGEVLLEDEEWERIKEAFDTFRGFGRDSVELVKRINEAKVVEVEEIEPEPEPEP